MNNPCDLGYIRENQRREGHLAAWKDHENWFTFKLDRKRRVRIKIEGKGSYYAGYYRAKVISAKTGTELNMPCNNSVFEISREFRPGTYYIKYSLNSTNPTVNNGYKMSVFLE